MSTENNEQEITKDQEVGESKDKNAAEIIKLALSHATFENKDIGGLVFGLLDSLASDMILTEFEESDTTVSLMSDVIDTIRDELDDIAGRIDDEEEEEEEEDNNDGDADERNEDENEEAARLRLENGDDDEDEDEDDFESPEFEDVDEDEDADEIIPNPPT